MKFTKSFGVNFEMLYIWKIWSKFANINKIHH